MKHLERIQRERPITEPLTKFLVVTNEALNPVRCENCLTTTQRKQISTKNVQRISGDECCRKCGLGLY